MIVWQPLAFFIFMAAALAELERQPFDIPTAESEVVGGPFIEYSGMRWSMFMLTSFANLFIYSLLAASIFSRWLELAVRGRRRHRAAAAVDFAEDERVDLRVHLGAFRDAAPAGRPADELSAGRC